MLPSTQMKHRSYYSTLLMRSSDTFESHKAGNIISELLFQQASEASLHVALKIGNKNTASKNARVCVRWHLELEPETGCFKLAERILMLQRVDPLGNNL